MVVPLLAYVFVSWSFVPPSGPAPTTDTFAREYARPTVFLVPPSAVPMNNRVTLLSDSMTDPRTHNYIRHGTLDLFAALNVATG
jgi:hypothetical protein